MDAKKISTGFPYPQPVSESPKPKLYLDSYRGIQRTSPLGSRMSGLSQRDIWMTYSRSPSLRAHASEDISTHGALVEIEDDDLVIICCKLGSYEVFDPVEQQFVPLRTSIRFKSDCLSDRKVYERYKQELCCLFNMFHYGKIGAKKLDAALMSLIEKYNDGSGDLAGASLSRLEGAGGSGYPSTSGYPPGTNACGGGVPVGIRLANNNGDPSTSGYPPGTHACGGGVPVGIGLFNNNGDPSSSVKHSPPGKGKVPHERSAGGFANVGGDATGSMNAYREGDLEMGRVNNNGDPPARGDVPHVAHTAEYGVNVARTVFRVSAAAASRTTTSHFAKASYAIGFADSGVAILLADTDWKAATPILAKAGVVACGVGVLADMGKDLPLSLFIGAMTAAIFIIIAAMVFAKRLA